MEIASWGTISWAYQLNRALVGEEHRKVLIGQPLSVRALAASLCLLPQMGTTLLPGRMWRTLHRCQ
jgi:hypothetical protein